MWVGVLGVAVFAFLLGWACGEMWGEGKPERDAREALKLAQLRGEIPPSGPFVKPEPPEPRTQK